MPLLRRHRVPADQVDLARSRVTALSSRRGWVPRVPQGTLSALTAPDLAETGATAAVDTIDAPGPADATTGVEAVTVRRLGRHANPVDPIGEFVPAGAGAGDTQDEITRGVVGSAITNRLPLPVRAVIEGLPPSVRQGRTGLQPAHAAVVVLVVLLGLAVTALSTGLGRPRVQAIEPAPASTILATGTPAPARDGATGTSAETTSEKLVIHVAGKVARPGIVQLPAGSRVIDAIEAAGGAEAGVDLTPLNLARVLTDGEQVAVGIDPPPQAVTGEGDAGPAAVSLNSASAEQLATLPGIGPALAARIVQWREQNGRFTAVDELLEVSGIGPARYDAIAGLVTL